ncbi:hypothetical protein [Crenothrix polyspora]|uniref:Uncharacterized protein n=1 Tax=Crenothrix polyspora TaxID=360316 RepID=A0A1R4HL24_9GAMM|nr:hypothetical protein [Crenothrix polyspora]SJM96590.1 conserved hypothetical protein [Crenothrix polyspora]
MPIPFSSALYYPYIDVKNERWLRSAALFWDSIRTIVPESYRDPYSSVVARELNDEGILEPVQVSSDMEEIESLTDTVLDFLTDPASTNVIFSSENHPSRIHPEKMSSELRYFLDIHPDKLPREIRSHFEHAFSEEGWYRVDPGFANFYMTLLASKLANRLGLGLITESSAADQLAIAVHKGRPLGSNDIDFQYRRRFGRHFHAFGPHRELPQEVAPGLLIDLIVQSIELPQNLSVKDLLKFKNDHREELSLFRREISKLTTDIPKDASVEALRQAVHDQYKAQVLPAMRSLRHSLQAQGWDAALNGFLKVSFFTAAPTSAAIFAGFPSSVALLAGAGVSLTASAVLLVNQLQRTKIDNPYSYLLTFAGHMHNSGFPNIHFALAIVLMTPSGVGYGFARDHTLDGTITIFGRNRDDDWTDTGANQQLAGNWDQLTQSRLHWRLVAYDTLTSGIQGLVEDLVKEVALQLGKVGIAALIALI